MSGLLPAIAEAHGGRRYPRLAVHAGVIESRAFGFVVRAAVEPGHVPAPVAALCNRRAVVRAGFHVPAAEACAVDAFRWQCLAGSESGDGMVADIAWENMPP